MKKFLMVLMVAEVPIEKILVLLRQAHLVEAQLVQVMVLVIEIEMI